MVTQRHDRLSLGLNIEISYFIVAILNITFQSIIIIFYNFESTARVDMLFFQAWVPAKKTQQYYDETKYLFLTCEYQQENMSCSEVSAHSLCKLFFESL